MRLDLGVAVICSAQLLVVLSTTSVTVALPSIQRALGFSSAALQWVIIAYTLIFGGLLLLGGRIGDAYGRRRIFSIGIATFTIASLAAAAAPDQGVLIAARGLQGLGAALASPCALALLTGRFPEGKPRNKAIGAYAATQGAGAAVGLVVGGALTQIDWRLTPLLNVPFGVLVLFLVPRVIQETPRHSARFDVGGAILATTALIGIALGASEAAQEGWSALLTVIPMVSAAVLLFAFIWLERRHRHPLLPLRIFSSRSRSGAFATMLCLSAVQNAAFFFIALYVQKVLGYSSLQGGLVYLPPSLSNSFMPMLWSKLVARLGGRPLVVAGLVLTVVGLFGLTHISTHSAYLKDILPWLMCVSLGSGLTFLPLTLAAVSRVDSADVGLASGLLTTAQSVGGSLGLAVLSTIAVATTNKQRDPLSAIALVKGYTTGFHVLIGITVAGLIIGALTLGKVRAPTPREAAIAATEPQPP